MDNLTITNVSAVIAAIAALLNIFFTFRNQRRTIFASVVSANRIKQIDDLRKDISQYIGLVVSIQHLRLSNDQRKTAVGSETSDKELIELASIIEVSKSEINMKITECIALKANLHIRLDLRDKKQSDIYQNLNKVWDNRKDGKKLSDSIKELSSITREFINSEWIKVEKLK